MNPGGHNVQFIQQLFPRYFCFSRLVLLTPSCTNYSYNNSWLIFLGKLKTRIR